MMFRPFGGSPDSGNISGNICGALSLALTGVVVELNPLRG
jgi:hypothetical protein